MQNGNDQAPFDASSPQGKPGCTFCQRSEITDILKETSHFFLAADHAPLVEGHLLIIPRQHYACYGDVPADLDEELFALKDELRRFYEQFYAPVVFLEHGVFRQTVFHAHLHCFPWGNLDYDITSNIHNAVVAQQEDIRDWYHARGHYFYLEDGEVALLFAPEMDRYMHIIQKVFQKGLAARGVPTRIRPAQQRYAEGRPMIEAARENWQAFQQQEVK
ncbi:MAG TPA: HIT family protein [Ktedonobacteraceae bacterium]|jgi:diadenosine tetraphosphate (Ap4A) HIT family hydrolase|nr:HIT family protein [Ktedonobacteraceae bacterium]